ncbi:MAG: cytochrome c [Ardenticatenales bacterium]|jgi:hypothetical protein|nr:cytochrome c [Ardenticatenales bacterium]
MAMQDDDAPFEVFRLGYKLFAWASLFVTLILTVAIMRTLFVTTPDGTATTKAMERVAPTLTALVSGRPTRDPNAPAPIDPAAVDAKMVTCKACHTLDALGYESKTCPDLSNASTTAAEHLASAGYTGKAAAGDIEAYLRESILDPGAYIVPGTTDTQYGKPGQSIMPAKGGADLSPADVDMIVGYLMTLR